ncbi:MAG: inositol monophosphatase [Spirochaetales bacterium]|nr:inositol monophosphatase [Spirochaetales bacterium]
MKTENYLDTSIIAARKAAEILLGYFQKEKNVSFKSAHYDMVTKADIESEKIIVSTIKEKFPCHNILAEENNYEQTDSPYTWIIDPLDGTNNFVHGIPVFSISIALAKNGSIIMGVVYDPTREELFCAQHGDGAMLNNKLVRVTEAEDLSSSILATGFYYNRGKEMEETLDNIKRFFLSGIIGIRRMGSAALDLCNVACGRLDGFWEYYLSPWDFAAGVYIVEQAGGKVTDQYNEKVKIAPSYIVSSNGKIHTKMLDIVGNKERGT